AQQLVDDAGAHAHALFLAAEAARQRQQVVTVATIDGEVLAGAKRRVGAGNQQGGQVPRGVLRGRAVGVGAPELGDPQDGRVLIRGTSRGGSRADQQFCATSSVS